MTNNFFTVKSNIKEIIILVFTNLLNSCYIKTVEYNKLLFTRYTFYSDTLLKI